jgi:hypothetical protein
MRESIVLGIAVGLLLASCTTSALTPPATVTTLAPDAERWFRLTWEPVAERDGARVRLRGYLENTYAEAVGRVQLLAQALDSNGNVVDQKIAWVPGAVPAFDRVYYEIPNMRPADKYRVTVWAYERRKFF